MNFFLDRWSRGYQHVRPNKWSKGENKPSIKPMLSSRQLAVGDKVIPRICIMVNKRVDGLGRTEPREEKRRDFEQPGTFAWS